jgi:hypothetical protein
VDLLLTETAHLPDQALEEARRAQREYVAEWAHLLHLVHPGMGATAARIRIQAVFTVALDAARTPHLRHNPGVPGALEIISTRLLMI